MMRVTKTTIHDLAANRKEKNAVFVQRRLKSGAWGKPQPSMRLGSETNEQVVDRLNKLNPGSEYRLAE